MSPEAWIALAALLLPVIAGVVWVCVQATLVRRDVRAMKKNELPHIFRVLKELPCRNRRPCPIKKVE